MQASNPSVVLNVPRHLYYLSTGSGHPEISPSRMDPATLNPSERPDEYSPPERSVPQREVLKVPPGGERTPDWRELPELAPQVGTGRQHRRGQAGSIGGDGADCVVFQFTVWHWWVGMARNGSMVCVWGEMWGEMYDKCGLTAWTQSVG